MFKGLKPWQIYLLLLNSFFIIISIIIIAVAAVAKAGSYVSSLSIIAGVIACGVFLLLASLVGLIATIRESQKTLFAYMIILGLVFIIQFSVSIAVLAVNEESVAKEGWCALDNTDRNTIQNKIGCLGFEDPDASHFNATLASYCLRPGDCPVSCSSPLCPAGPPPGTASPCDTCYDALKDQINTMLKRAGGVGLAFAFTELVGIFAAFRFRKQKHEKPKYNEFL